MKIKKSLLLLSFLFMISTAAVSFGWRDEYHPKSKNNNTIPKVAERSASAFMESRINQLYARLKPFAKTLSPEVFRQAYIGYLNIKDSGKTNSSLLSIADLSVPSREPRLWIIDVERDSVLLNTYVSHGRGSGLLEANSFSNRPNSNQSSLGFYLTGETYQGKHGRSLRLDGLDKGFNNNARPRAIVLHGAPYVGANILSRQNRMGLSLGCPAVPENLKDQIINLIKDRSVLYIYGKSTVYHSVFLDENHASKTWMAMAGEEIAAEADTVTGNLL